ncbi:MAG: type II secretion system F family protein [Oscillospiraceae bacterium]|nr:type II secretion system F family protein [Oscillospiraceae bacterium]MCI9550598.1 type II secretion system F family protein [Oscillospiraceae bacterium]
MGKTITNGELSSLTMELSMLLHAGIGVGDALSMLSGEDGYRDLLDGMARRADEGEPLSQCLREGGRIPAYVCGLVEVGEETGRTEEALAALSRYYERRARLDRQVRSALLYPAVMLVLMLLVIAVLLVRVLPIFDDVYASLGGRLTGVAGGLLALGRGLDAAMPVLWVVLAVAVGFFAAFAGVESFRDRVLALWRRGRGDRGVSRRMNNARLAQAMAMGMASGLPLERSMELAASLMEDVPPARARCEDCRARLEGGASLSAAMGESGLLPAGACRLLEIGQRGGTADAAMDKIARDLSEDGEAALEELVSRVEPSLVLVCSVMVGVILLSVMLPLMHIMSAIG